MPFFGNLSQSERLKIYHMETSCFDQKVSVYYVLLLALIGMRQGTFQPLCFLDQTLLAEFIPKSSKLFWR